MRETRILFPYSNSSSKAASSEMLSKSLLRLDHAIDCVEYENKDEKIQLENLNSPIWWSMQFDRGAFALSNCIGFVFREWDFSTRWGQKQEKHGFFVLLHSFLPILRNNSLSNRIPRSKSRRSRQRYIEIDHFRICFYRLYHVLFINVLYIHGFPH